MGRGFAVDVACGISGGRTLVAIGDKWLLTTNSTLVNTLICTLREVIE